MRVLVTGAAGFIGTGVCAALSAAGHEVVAVDAMLTAAHGATSVPPEGVLEVDVRDAEPRPQRVEPAMRFAERVARALHQRAAAASSWSRATANRPSRSPISSARSRAPRATLAT